MTITEEDALRAVEWIKDSASTMAGARANRLYMEQWIKTVKAECYEAQPPGLSIADRENKAQTSPKYLAALQAFKESIEIDERFRFLVKAAEAKYEAWRTISANERRG